MNSSFAGPEAYAVLRKKYKVMNTKWNTSEYRLKGQKKATTYDKWWKSNTCHKHDQFLGTFWSCVGGLLHEGALTLDFHQCHNFSILVSFISSAPTFLMWGIEFCFVQHTQLIRAHMLPFHLLVRNIWPWTISILKAHSLPDITSTGKGSPKHAGEKGLEEDSVHLMPKTQWASVIRQKSHTKRVDEKNESRHWGSDIRHLHHSSAH